MDAERFSTTDRYLAAYLLSQGHPMLSTRTNDARRVTFIFTESDALTLTLSAYHASPHFSFVDALLTINQIIRSAVPRTTEEQGRTG